MSPHHYDPNIDYKKLRQLAEEFLNKWKEVRALYLDATAGFTLLQKDLEEEQARLSETLQGADPDYNQFKDTCSFSYDKIFSGNFCTSGILSGTQGEAKLRNAHGGANYTAMGQACLVILFDFWNDYLRYEYVAAKGHKRKKTAAREYAQHDLWNDLGYLRNSILHNQGDASRHVKNCELIKWFQPGDKIVLTPVHMRRLFLALLKFRNELFKEQFPEHYIQIPKRKPTSQPS